MFEMAFDGMDDEDKKEHGDLKRAMDRKRTQGRGTKRKLGLPKAKPRAKAKAAVAPAPPVAPPAPPAPPPAAPAEAEAAPLPEPVAARPPPQLRGDYKYVRYHGYHIVFSTSLKKTNAHCLCAGHLVPGVEVHPKCHTDRLVPFGHLDLELARAVA